MIVTRHLTLTPPEEKTIPQVVRWLNDKDLMKYSEQRHLTHHDDTQRVYIMMMHEPHKYMEIHYGKAVIGTISAHVDVNDVANVGILVGERGCWGRGLGTEAWQAFCDHLLGNGIRKIEAGCMEVNFGMIHIFRKTGMQYEGRRHAHFLVGEDTVDEVMYGRFT